MIGVDLDNTIIDYSAVFVTAARELGFDRMGELPSTKHGIRRWLQAAGRNDLWTELQGYVYGPGLEKALPFPGVLECLGAWRKMSLEFCIVSHKSAYPALGPRYALRELALDWLEAQGFFQQDGLGLDRRQVFFCDDRSGKVSQIAAANCSHFIDDLPEVFAEPDFPERTRQCLFDPEDVHQAWPGVSRCCNWSEVNRWVQVT